MENMVYAERLNGPLDILKALSGSAYGSYRFRDNVGDEGTWRQCTRRDATGRYYHSQYGSVQATVRCTGCHSNLNLASEWVAEVKETWKPEALAYGFEFEGKFNEIPTGVQDQPEFDYECYGGEPCFAHMRTHYHPERDGGDYLKDSYGRPLPLDPQPQPWKLLPLKYRLYIVKHYGEPPRVLGGDSDISIEDWLQNYRLNRDGNLGH